MGNGFKKPFLTYKQQRNKLVNEKGLLIDDEDLLRLVLEDYSYYVIINGYKDLFMAEGTDVFIPGTTLSMLYQTHWLEVNLNSILFKYSLVVERKLKSHIAYVIGRDYGVMENEYLHEDNYSKSRRDKGKLKRLKAEINKCKFQDRSARHYAQKYKNLPPWITAKALSFGNAVLWYGILRGSKKQEIVNSFLNLNDFNSEELKDYFYRLIQQVYRFRNLSAHGNRIFDIKLDEKYSLKYNQLKKAGLSDFFDGQSRSGLYSIIFSILILIDDPYAVNNYIKELNDFLETYSGDDYIFLNRNVYELFNLPNDLIEKMLSYVKIITP